MINIILNSLRNVTWKTIVRTILVMGLALLISFAWVNISNSVTEGIIARNERLSNMIKVTDNDVLKYCINSQVNEFLIRGNAKAVQPVSLPELKGEYSYIKKTKYHYESHTETYTETYTDSNGKTHTRTRTKTVWDWEYKDSWKWSTETVILLNEEFEYKNTSHSSRTIRYEDYGTKTNLDWKDNHYYYTDKNTRYEYEVTPIEYTSTFISNYNKELIQGFGDREIESVIAPHSITGWRIFFYILIGITLIGSIVLLIFWEEIFPNFLSD